MTREYTISHTLLQQVQILELAEGQAASAAGTILSDLGASVVKLVHPAATLSELEIRLDHRGKQLLRMEDTQSVTETLSRADVLITDFTKKKLEQIGIDRQSSKRWPQLIHAHISALGYDHEGVQISDDAAFYVKSGTTGLMSSEKPLRFGNGQASRSGAFALTSAVIAELLRRERNGFAGAVETTLLASGMYSISNDVTVVQGSEKQPPQYDRRKPLNALGNSYRCADGQWLLLGVASAADAWNKFRTIVDDPTWMSNPLFATEKLRRTNTTEIVKLLDVEFSQHTRPEWSKRLGHIGINWNPIAMPPDVILDPQFDACEIISRLHFLATPIVVRDAPKKEFDLTLPTFDIGSWDQKRLPVPQKNPKLPLSGIRVLDTSHYVAAPALGSLLVDLGAEVIKVEPPGGDPRRGALPHLVEGDPPGLNRSYHMDNRGKRSIEVDLSDSPSLEKLHTLISSCDILITNMLPYRQKKYGLDGKTITSDNPKLIYVSLTAHGSTGPAAKDGGFDLTAFFARSGILGSLTAQVGIPPRSRSGQGDHIATLVLLTGLLAAVHKQRNCQRGSIIETSLLAIGTYTIGEELLRQKMGLPTGSIKPTDDYYQCSDGKWIRLGAAANDIPFNETPETMAKKDSSYWLEYYRDRDIPAMEIPTMTEVLVDPLVQRNEILGSIHVPPTGHIGSVRAPYRFHDWNIRPFTRGPNLGEHNDLLR